MSPTARHTFTTCVMALTAVTGLSAAITFTSTWKSPDAGAVQFTGKKVAALVISNDDALRVPGEETLARELSARGMQGVATYRIAPKEELARAETARPWFERANLEGVVAVRPVSVDRQKTYTPSMWVSEYYGSFWGYYGYGWSTVLVPASRRTETNVVVETTIYSVPRNQLLWAAVTQTTNAKDLPSFVQELVKRSVEVLRDQGLARGASR